MRGNLHEKNVMFTILMRKIENKKKQDKREERSRWRDEGKHDNDQKMRQQMKLNNFATVCQVVYIGEWVPQRQRRRGGSKVMNILPTYFVVVIIIINNVFVFIVIVIILLLRHAASHFPLTIAGAVIVLFRPLLNPNSPFIFLAVKYCSCIFKISIRFILHNKVQLQQFSLPYPTLLSHDVIGSCCQLALLKHTQKGTCM